MRLRPSASRRLHSATAFYRLDRGSPTGPSVAKRLPIGPRSGTFGCVLLDPQCGFGNVVCPK